MVFRNIGSWDHHGGCTSGGGFGCYWNEFHKRGDLYVVLWQGILGEVLEEVWPNKSMCQWVDWLTSPTSGEETTNTKWLIAVFTGTKKNDRRPDPRIKSWGKPLKSLKDMLSNRCNLKGSLVFFQYHWIYGIKKFFEIRNTQRVWKDYQGVTHNTYNGGHIETNHHVICSM